MYIIKSGISDMRSGIKRKTEQPNPSGDYSTASSSATGRVFTSKASSNDLLWC